MNSMTVAVAMKLQTAFPVDRYIQVNTMVTMYSNQTVIGERCVSRLLLSSLPLKCTTSMTRNTLHRDGKVAEVARRRAC